MGELRETLVLLPGMMCDQRLFAPQIERLSARHDVIVGDLTGACSIGGLAERVLQSVEAASFNLAGLSMGGIVAMAMAGLAPSRIRRLALLDTNHLADAPERKAMRDAQIGRVEAGELRAVIAHEMKPHYLGEASRRDQALLDLLITMAIDLGPTAFVRQSRALRERADQAAPLKAYQGPALVLCGGEDVLCPPARHRDIARLLERSELVEIEGAGHITTLEAPAAVNGALENWLRRPLQP